MMGQDKCKSVSLSPERS